MITKNELDDLVKKYETKSFIKDDPIRFPHRFRDKKDIELAGFIASLFAYGNRKLFIAKLNDLFERAENDISNYVINGDFSNLKGLEYRFSKDFDIIPVFDILHELYTKSNGLEELFEFGWKNKTNASKADGGNFSNCSGLFLFQSTKKRWTRILSYDSKSKKWRCDEADEHVFAMDGSQISC